MVKSAIGIVRNDPYLEPYADAIGGRHDHAVWKINQLTRNGKMTLSDFADGYNYYGLHQVKEGWVFREWAPNATDIFLVGDFNDWKEVEDMVMTDPIADMLTRIRNALVVKHEVIQVPASNMKKAIADILTEEGFIKGYTVIDDGNQGTLKLTLKYAKNNERVISGLKRISKPGLRVYANKDEIPKVLGGLGIAIISTSKGVMTDKQARKLSVGGEVLCYVW